MVRQRFFATGLAVLLVSPALHAEIYKCADVDGPTVYSQQPCSPTATKVQIDSQRSASPTTADCAYAVHFANSVASLMQMRLDKPTTIRTYDDAGGLSAGARRLIDYVYLYDGTNGMTRDRIASLARAQCESGSFGDVSCSALPASYIKSGGGCGDEFNASKAGPNVNVFAIRHEEEAARLAEQSKIKKAQMEKYWANYEDRERVRKCREPIQQEISRRDMAINMGAHPSQHKHELKRLRRQLSKCR